MNKKQLIAKIAEEADITKDCAKMLLSITLDLIIREIVAGNEVKLPRFGKFYVKTIPARKGVCAIGNVPYESPEKKKYAFKGSTI